MKLWKIKRFFSRNKQKITESEAQKLDAKLRRKREKDLSKKVRRRGTKLTTKEWREYLIKVGEEISDEFTYSQIDNAIREEEGRFLKRKRGKRNLEVYGFLVRNYPDWRELIDEMVLEIALDFAKKKSKVQIVKVIFQYNLEDFIITGVLFAKEIKLKKLPNQPFRRAVFVSFKFLKDLIDWESNFEFKIDGYKTKVEYGWANMSILRWAKHDFPIILVNHTPGQDVMLLDAIAESKDIQAVLDKVQKKIISYYRSDEEMYLDEIDQERQRAEKWKRKHSILKGDVIAENRKHLTNIIKEDQEGPIESEKSKLDNKKLMLILIVIAIIIGIVGVFV